MRKGLGIAGGVLLVAALVAYKFFGADVQIKLEHAAGTAWNGAKAELTRRQTQELTTAFAGITLEPSVVPQIVACVVPKAIKALNKTGCSYHYNKATTSRAEHVRKQDACLLAVGYEKTANKLTRQCMALHFPNKWEVFEKPLVATMTKAAPATIPDKAAWGRCTSSKIIAALNKTTCRPLNADPLATKPINSIDDCAKKEGLMKELPTFGRACLP